MRNVPTTSGHARLPGTWDGSDPRELHVVPVLLGQGRRLFDNLQAEHIELNLVCRLTTPEVEELAQHITPLRYRVRRP